MRTEISKLKDRSETVSQGQDDIIKAKEAIDMEREALKMDKKTLANLRSEHSRLKDDFRYVFYHKIHLLKYGLIGWTELF